jgi:chromosome segregation ATPase
MAPSHLVPSIRPLDFGFKEDVLRVIDPIIENLKTEIQENQINSSPDEKLNNPRSDSSNIKNQQISDFQLKLEAMEKEISKFNKQEPSADKELKETVKILMERINNLESQKTQECKCEYIVDTVDNISVELTNIKAQSEKLSKRVQSINVENFISLDVFESQIHQIQNTIVSVQNSSSSSDITAKDVKNAISELEKKMSTVQENSESQLQDQIDHLEGLIQVRASDSQEKFESLELKIKGNIIFIIL